MRVLHDTGRNAPIAKTLDCDLGFFARYLANPRTRGNAAMNLEPQSLCGCLAVGGDDNVDEIGHADLTIPDVIRELPCAIARQQPHWWQVRSRPVVPISEAPA